jgi:hypothetical protein
MCLQLRYNTSVTQLSINYTQKCNRGVHIVLNNLSALRTPQGIGTNCPQNYVLKLAILERMIGRGEYVL